MDFLEHYEPEMMAVEDSPHVEKTVSGLMHNPGIAVHWSASEQRLLEKLILRFPSTKYPKVTMYALIASHFEEKTVRDVALRHRWMMEKRNAPDTQNSPVIGLDNVGGSTLIDTNEPMWQFLIMTSEMFSKICANLELSKLKDNIILLCEVTQNISTALNCISYDVTEKTKRMPRLSSVVDELLDHVLPFLPLE